MKRIPWLVRRRADRVVERWTSLDANPEAADEVIERDIRRWIGPAADELMDYAQDRPLRQYVALVTAFSGTVVIVVFCQTLMDSGLGEHIWWFGTIVALVFFGPATHLIKPLKTSTTRARIRSHIGHAATTALLRRRAFVVKAPTQRTEGVNAREAEFLTAEWMAHLGAPEARVTQYRHDGGIDVVTHCFAVQVKNRTDKVPVTVIREIQGAAQRDNKLPMVFAASHFTRPARAEAREMAIPLFIFRAKEGRLVAANPQALHYLQNGLHVPLPEALRVRPRVDSINRRPATTSD
ncbi:restriction endonuclease [Amnibacterium flavum]|uniref:Restriction endonuclease type IV Mrr domain-containing protein n=1 Tax=Amnibacterium flavum TaxID=2173173 RepID=A0A2V1HPJ2_9MICO|nr:restriction endonuclease [Amnibacterium flavum]PVZ94553.1 hypothetical protein DDQ50_12700 [Amnibacterium flavum]